MYLDEYISYNCQHICLSLAFGYCYQSLYNTAAIGLCDTRLDF